MLRLRPHIDRNNFYLYVGGADLRLLKGYEKMEKKPMSFEMFFKLINPNLTKAQIKIYMDLYKRIPSKNSSSKTPEILSHAMDLYKVYLEKHLDHLEQEKERRFKEFEARKERHYTSSENKEERKNK
jgi:hypothetical protein